MQNRFSRLACLVIALVGVGLSGVAAQLGQRPAAEWIPSLERPERIESLKIDFIMSKLDLKPGHTVADVGAGAGVISLPLARAVAPGGKVYAVDIDQGFLDHINLRARQHGVSNIQPVFGKYADPNLPARDVDLAFFHVVLHHIENRSGYVKALAQYIKPDGRIAIIEQSAEKGAHRNQPHLVVTKDQVNGWMTDAGFKPVQEIEGLPEYKWFTIYARR